MGGGLSASNSTAVGSQSGDASAGLSFDAVYNAAFQVGGSGKQSQTTDTDTGKSSGVGTVTYLSFGLAALAIIGIIATRH